MRIVKLVRTASKEANALVVIAIFILFTKILFLNRYPALFIGAYELGVIAEAILASVIASYVFYFLVVHIKEYSDREILRPYIEKHSKRVIGCCITQIKAVEKTAAEKLKLTALTKAEITLAFSKIQPYSHAPLLISTHPEKYADWFQYFAYQGSRTKKSIAKLLDQLPFLDAKLVSIITAIDDANHFLTMEHHQHIPIKNPDLSIWANDFHEYYLLCMQLDSHLIQLGFSSAKPKSQY